MQKQIQKGSLFVFLLFIIVHAHAYAGYEKEMLAGKEMFSTAKTLEETELITKHFSRIADANKTEWLPLYYAAFSSLLVGVKHQKEDMKDQWYEKGIAFIERAKAIKKDESEILAMEGYLRLMYVANRPMLRAPTQTGDAKDLLEKAKALNPANPRPWFIHGQNTFYTPEFIGGGPEKAKPLLEKAIALYNSFTPADSLMPAWGKEQCEKLLMKCKEQK